MACGVPCVATDVGDSGWIIDGNGRVVPSQDPEALAEALGWLDNLGAEGRRALGESARARVIGEFSLARVAQEYEVLFDKVLGRPPARNEARSEERRVGKEGVRKGK